MRMLFKQRLFSWFDSYDIYGEDGQVLYTVKGQLSWGHCLKIYDASGREVGMVKEKILTFLPKFEMYIQGNYAGCIRREFSFLKPRYQIEVNDWEVEGSFWEWDYTILSGSGYVVANVSKELLHLTDTYVLDVTDPADALGVLMFVLAVDAEKCSRN